MIVKVFISYSHRDERYLAEDSLRGYLRALEAGGVEFWWDRQITAASAWDAVIQNRINEADIALVLVSQAFLNSEYIQKREVKEFLEAAAGRGMIIFPIILSPCEWERHEWLSSRQFLPRDGKSIERDYREEGERQALFREILHDLRVQVETARKRKAPRFSPGWFAVYGRHYARHMWKGLVLTAALLAAIFLAEWAGLLHGPEVQAYRALQYPLYLLRSEKDLPVVVLDIQAMSPDKNRPTSRSALKDLVRNIASVGPAAIGLAIDFAPTEKNGYGLIENDTDFFNFCMNRVETKNTPVVLGVFGVETMGPKFWLGNEKYKGLAASLAIPNENLEHMPRWFGGAGSGEKLPSFSYALARESGMINSGPPRGVRWAVEQFFEPRSAQEIQRQEFLMDYSHLELIKSSLQAVGSPAEITGPSWGEKLRGRIVLAGDTVFNGETPNPVPGRETNVPGIYIHASGVDTLVRGPLYALRPAVRVALAFAISLLLLALKVRVYNRFPFMEQERLRYRKKIKYAALAALCVAVVGIALVVSLRIVWTDFLLIALAQGIYFIAERG